MRIELTYKSEIKILDFNLESITIGKAKECDLQLKGWFVAEKHAVIKHLSAGYVLEDLKRGANGTEVNGKKIDLYGPISLNKDEIYIANYKIRVLEELGQVVPDAIFVNAKQVDISGINLEKNHPQPDIILNTQLAVSNQETATLKALELEWIAILRGHLLKKVDLRRKDVASMTPEELRSETTESLDRVFFEMSAEIPTQLDLTRLKKRILDEAIGLGPLEELLSDIRVTEIMVNAKDEIFIEQNGRIVKSILEFTNDQAILDVIERIVTPLGRRIDESSPMVDARLADGSRVNAIIPPLAIKGPTITIRKFPSKKITSDDLVGFGSMSDGMANFLKVCVAHKKNVIISGGTGSGKTTLLNVLSSFIPRGERVITIEDAAELRLDHDHLISLEARPGNSEGKGIVIIRDLVKNSLRMRPDRIVIGECRGSETLDMLQAMNTGHEGSLTTLHSNSPRDAVARMETMVMMAGMDLPLTAIRDQITSAIDIIVQQTRFSCGSRRVTYITELTGMESGKIQLQDIYKFNRTGFDVQSGKVSGTFDACGVVPSFYEELRMSGIDLDISKFSDEV